MRKSKRDVSIEIMRILACFLVICIHVDAGMRIGGRISKSAVFLACLRADAVAFFWFLSGMHFFRRRAYRQVLGAMFRRIILPALALIIFIFYCDGWLFGGETILQSMVHPASDYRQLLRGLILEWHSPVPYTGPLWYVFTYILLCFLQPLGSAFAEYLESPARIRGFCLISAGILLLNDCSLNHFGGFSHHTFGAAVPAFIIMLYGHLTARHRKWLDTHLKPAAAAAIFAGLNVVRAIIQIHLMETAEGYSDFILFWYTSIGLCCTITVYVLCRTVSRRIQPGGIAESVFLWLGSMTFPVYLVHMLIREWLFQHGFREALWRTLSGIRYVGIQHGLYYLCFGLLIFSGGLVVSVCLRAVKTGFCRILYVTGGK